MPPAEQLTLRPAGHRQDAAGAGADGQRVRLMPAASVPMSLRAPLASPNRIGVPMTTRMNSRAASASASRGRSRSSPDSSSAANRPAPSMSPVQAQILALFRTLQRAYQLGCLFITHNISVVEYIAHYVAVPLCQATSRLY